MRVAKNPSRREEQWHSKKKSLLIPVVSFGLLFCAFASVFLYMNLARLEVPTVGLAKRNATALYFIPFNATSNKITATRPQGPAKQNATALHSIITFNATAPHSITFTATSNKVLATRPRDTPRSTKQAIQEHISFQSCFRAESKTWSEDSAKQGPDSVGIIVQHSHPNKEIIPVKSGLVSTVLQAYNGHHNLVLRPDDIWQAILTQFSFYINARAEEVRDRIVDFKGKKDLTVATAGTLFSIDYGELAERMVEEISKNIKEPDLTAWLLPSFSTTTTDDRVAASVAVMSTMQKYFRYKAFLLCGIPSVTLLGTPDDWMKLRLKLDRLLSFELDGQTHMTEWHRWLVEIVDNLVQSANGKPDLKFWDQVASHRSAGCGSSQISGWISVFSVWSETGEWQGGRRYIGASTKSKYPIIDTDDLASGAVLVPILVNDNGVEHNCIMFSGQFGMNVDDETVSPAIDWCLAMKEEKPNARERFGLS